MRIRTIKPEFFLHEGIFELEKETGLPIRLAYIGLWCAADRSGRFKWEPRKLGIQILPYDSADFSRVLDALTTRGFIVRYASATGEFGAIPSFDRHQIINNREKPSEYPEPPEDVVNQHIDACPTRAPRDNGDEKASLSGREGKGKEGNKEGKGTYPQTPAPSAWHPCDQQQQVNRWFHRRDSTPWTEKERKAWNAIHAESIADGLVILAPPYLAAEKFCRRDLLTLLNNWQGEIDRWRSYKPALRSDVQAIETDEELGFLTNDDAIFHKDNP